MTEQPKSKSHSDADKPAPRKRGRGRGKVGRDAIIVSTRMLLREVQPASLTRKSVAEAADVDPALVRYYFSDLSTLLTEVLKVLVAEYRELHGKLDIDPEDPVDGLQKRVHHMIRYFTREANFHALFTEQIVNGKDEWALETRNAFTDNFGSSLVGLVESGRRQGLFREDFDARLVYLAMIGASHFLSASRPIFERLYGEAMDPNDVAEEYAQLVSAMIIKGISK